MKKAVLFAIVLLVGVGINGPSVYSAEGHMAAVSHSQEFNKMKELVGTWEGTTDMGKGNEAVKATYELTSGGSAIVERLFAGNPHEMVTVYHDSGGRLSMTHFCSLGNQPHMKLKNRSDRFLEFVLSDKNHGLSSLKETHMHGLKISFDDKDSITQTWVLYDKGKKKADSVIKLTRAR